MTRNGGRNYSVYMVFEAEPVGTAAGQESEGAVSEENLAAVASALWRRRPDFSAAVAIAATGSGSGADSADGSSGASAGAMAGGLEFRAAVEAPGAGEASAELEREVSRAAAEAGLGVRSTTANVEPWEQFSASVAVGGNTRGGDAGGELYHRDDLRRELVGVSEIAEMLGVLRTSAGHVRGRRGFPAPVADLAMGPVYLAGEVRGYARRNPARRAGRQAVSRSEKGSENRSPEGRSPALDAALDSLGESGRSDAERRGEA